jgi:hypothetical protein
MPLIAGPILADFETPFWGDARDSRRKLTDLLVDWRRRHRS